MEKRDYKLKMAIVAGASHALTYKNKNIRASDHEILQHITATAQEIAKKIEDDDE